MNDDKALDVTSRPLMIGDFDGRPDGPLLTVWQVAALLQVSDDMVRSLCDDGALRGIRIGRSYKVVWASLYNYLVRCTVLPLPTAERFAGPPIVFATGVDDRRARPRPGKLLLSEDLDGMTIAELRGAILLRRCALAMCAAALNPAALAGEVELLQLELSQRVATAS